MFLDDVDHLSLREVDLVRVLPVVVGQDTVLLQVFHLVRVGDDGVCGCRWEGEKGEQEERGREKEREKGEQEERGGRGGERERESGRRERGDGRGEREIYRREE